MRKETGDLSELIASIKEKGVLEPIIVRAKKDRYEIIIGSRRYQATKKAGLKTIPAIIKEMSDVDALVTSLVENIQRGELAVRDEGEAYKILQSKFGGIRQIERETGIPNRRIVETLEAYEALLKLEPFGIKVVARQPSSSEERQTGVVIPKHHATELERAFRAVKLPEKEKKQKFVEFAKAIGPLEREQARKVLDYFKMYPEKSADKIVDKVLSKVSMETYLPPQVARRIDEIAEQSGRKIEEVTSEIIEKGLQVTTVGAEAEERGIKSGGIELPQQTLSTQIHNWVLWNLDRIKLDSDFYIVGYSERTVEQFTEVLKKLKIKTLIDARYEPHSQYKPEFNKEALERHFNKHNIKYVHYQELGVPRDVRAKLAKTGNYREFFSWYDDNVIPQFKDGLFKEISKMSKPVAFMCLEFDPTTCHRHRIALALEKKGFVVPNF